MPQPFDNTLIPVVLSDQQFQATGVYLDNWLGLHYVVIDPRRLVVRVWSKVSFGHSLVGGANSNYMFSARRLGAAWFTNGPQMAFPPGAGLTTRWQRFLLGLHLLLGTVWQPFDDVIAAGMLWPGKNIVKSFFARTGTGSFGNYSIGDGPPTGDDGVGGVVRIVQAGGVVTSADTAGLAAKVGIAAWGLAPIAVPVPTLEWPSEIPYLPQGEEEEPPETPPLLDGLVVSAGSDVPIWSGTLAGSMVAVGVKEAVAMDGSDSVICGHGNTMLVRCTFFKQQIQRWGLFAR